MSKATVKPTQKDGLSSASCACSAAGINPIYVAYYSHEQSDCYKIDIPWTRYAKDTRVLCKVSDGIETARLLATGVILKALTEVMGQPPNNQAQRPAG